MGVESNKKDEARDAKKTNKTSSRRVSRTNAGEVADWGGVDPKALQDAIQVVAMQGGALRFSYTRDGGAYCIGILGDGEPYNEYVKPSEDIDAYLRKLADAWRP